MMRRYHPANQTWTTSYFGMDGQGHTRLLLSGTGAVQAVYTYDAWGNPQTPAIDSNPFRWNGAFGYVYIPLTGLYHVGAREYDPRTARWLQRDPIIFSQNFLTAFR